jgi:hypothetical protein
METFNDYKVRVTDRTPRVQATNAQVCAEGEHVTLRAKRTFLFTAEEAA